MPKKRMTVREFLAIPQGERPTMMDAERLWERIGELETALEQATAHKSLDIGDKVRVIAHRSDFFNQVGTVRNIGGNTPSGYSYFLHLPTYHGDGLWFADFEVERIGAAR